MRPLPGFQVFDDRVGGFLVHILYCKSARFKFFECLGCGKHEIRQFVFAARRLHDADRLLRQASERIAGFVVVVPPLVYLLPLFECMDHRKDVE